MTTSGVATLQDEVLRVFAQVTRYPAEILAPEASLEEDLGIDSVKLGEIFAVLREKYDLPEKLEIRGESLKTIARISDALHAYVSDRAEAATPPPVPRAVPSTSRRTGGAGSTMPEAMPQRVREIFANVTRYPPDILLPGASLEEDLGIDSVKLGEIFAVLREEYDLPEKLEIRGESLKTIQGITDALGAYLSKRAESAAAVAAPASGPGASVLSVAIGPPENGVASARSAAAAATDGHLQSFAARAGERKPFVGKVAFISGSGRGLGKDIAVHLAELGATVIVNSFHSRKRGEETAEEIKARGGDAWHLWGSMANPAHVREMFDQIRERHGSLDFFVSNASNGMLASIEDLTAEHWEKAFRTNVVGLHQAAVHAASLMKKKGGGRIVTLSSPAAHGYVEYFGCMGPVKAAVEALTRALAIEFARYNIQVNCVSPGPIDGELLRKWPESHRLIPQWTDATPLGRLCEPRDVSHFIAYLLSEPARAFTGSVLVLDGGISSQGW